LESTPVLPEAFVTHQTPHRLRVKIPSKKGDAAFFGGLKELLSGYPGIDQVQVNPVTGSILLLHRVDAATLKQMAIRFGFVQPQSPTTRTATLHQRVIASFRHFDDQVKASTKGELDIPSVAFLGLIGAGMYQLSIGNFAAPAWYTAFWYASSIILNIQSTKDSEGSDNSTSA
jgi:hypothetical protein